jgi:hypothetical protein
MLIFVMFGYLQGFSPVQFNQPGATAFGAEGIAAA